MIYVKRNNNLVSATSGGVPMPVGFVYTQYPGQSAPADLFGGTWELYSTNKSTTTVGSPAIFGNCQAAASYGCLTASTCTGCVKHTHNPPSATSCYTVEHTHTSKTVAVATGAENRPKNYTVRIWIKTA